MDKITDIKSFIQSVEKYDAMTQDTTPKLNAIFVDEKIADKMKKFFNVADGGSIWTGYKED